jgi:hypothetical protein
MGRFAELIVFNGLTPISFRTNRERRVPPPRKPTASILTNGVTRRVSKDALVSPPGAPFETHLRCSSGRGVCRFILRNSNRRPLVRQEKVDCLAGAPSLEKCACAAGGNRPNETTGSNGGPLVAPILRLAPPSAGQTTGIDPKRAFEVNSMSRRYPPECGRRRNREIAPSLDIRPRRRS